MHKHSAQPVVRFAPSPNGYLHLGHAYSALKNFVFAKEHDGRFLLRIEDIDTMRSKQEFVDAIFEDLHWLGLAWEDPARRQSEHLQDYADAMARLGARGLLYRCTCTRGDIRDAVESAPDWPVDPDGSPVYPGVCRGNRASAVSEFTLRRKEFALRLDLQKAMQSCGGDLCWNECHEADTPASVCINAGTWGDVILARRDIGASYHIAVVVDDALQGVTDVIRGADLYAATAIHRLLQTLLGVPAPVYRHHRLIVDGAGNKLAKSAIAKPLRAWRAEGASPSQIRSMLGFEKL